MKQSIFVKIVFILMIIAIACCIKTTKCYADDYSWDNIGSVISYLNADKNNQVYVTRNLLKTSPYVFCRDRGTPLYDNSYYKWDKEKVDAGENPTVYQPFKEDGSITAEGADIAYILASDTNEYPKTISGYGPIQLAYWATVQPEKTNPNTLTGDALRLYYEAQAYKDYVKEIIKFKNEHEQTTKYTPIFNTDEAKQEFLEDNDDIVKIGPFTAEYAKIWNSKMRNWIWNYNI